MFCLVVPSIFDRLVGLLPTAVIGDTMAGLGMRTWIALLLGLSVQLQTAVEGVRLPACSSENGAIELTEGQSGQQTTCEDVSHDGILQWIAGPPGQELTFVTCDSPNQTCSPFNENVFTGTRGPSSSTLTFVLMATRSRSYGGYYIACRLQGCGRASCPVDIIYSPSDSEVFCDVSTNRWNVTLSCNISKAFSYRSRYTCDFRQGRAAGPSVGESSYSSDSSNNNVMGTCNSTVVIPTAEGTYTYTAVISPGAKQVSVSGTVTVESPSQDPVINCSTLQGGYIPENTQLSCTCTASHLGNPQGRLLVYHGSNVIVNGNYGDGSVEFRQASVSRSDNSTVYRCVLNWSSEGNQDRDTTFTLRVAYPPVLPTITYRNQRYPFLVGESPTVYCTLPTGPDSGNPPASLTLEGQTGSAGQSEVSVTLTSLSTVDNGQRVVCEARNVYTDYTNNTAVARETTLDVYYVSQTITTLQSNTCTMASSTTCIVKEGQRVRVNCSAHSNPPIASAAWRQSGDSVLDLIADRDTALSHLCDITTVTVNSDDRLPLRSNISLTVLTTYVAEIQAFTTNSRSDIITVNEADHVTLNCTAIGRPTPRMQISTDSRPMVSRPQGPVTVEQMATLTYDQSDVPCDFGGTYTCQVDNGEGRTHTSSVAVFVNCTPRLQEGAPDYMRYNDKPVSLLINLTMYPTPNTQTLLYLGPLSNSSSSQPARDDLFSLHCDVSDVSRPYWTTCNLTILSAAEGDKGFYMVTVGNELGAVVFRFQLDVSGRSQPIKDSNKGSSNFSTGAAVGVILAVVAVVVVIGVAWLWRRHRVLPRAVNEGGEQGRRSSKDNEDHQDYLSPIPPPAPQHDAEVYELPGSGMPPRAESQSGPSEYSTLKSSDIGQKSVYSSLTQYCNTQSDVDTGPVYENTGMTEQNVYANQQNQQ